MANPVFVDCASDVFTKVATNVTAGKVHQAKAPVGGWVQTYKATGEAAPANTVSLGVPVFYESNTFTIAASAAIDVYLMPVGSAGSVRVDII